MRKKRVNILHFFGLKIDAGEDETTEEEEEEHPPKFNYPRMRAKPNEKESEFLRRRLSSYLNTQGFGRGGVQYGHGKRLLMDGQLKNILGILSREQQEDVQQQWLKRLSIRYSMLKALTLSILLRMDPMSLI